MRALRELFELREASKSVIGCEVSVRRGGLRAACLQWRAASPTRVHGTAFRAEIQIKSTLIFSIRVGFRD